VIGVIDEVDRDDSRPVRVENRHSKASKEEISDDFEPFSVECVEPFQSSIVTRCSVGVFAGFPDRGLIDTGQHNNGPDIAGCRGGSTSGKLLCSWS